MWRVTLHCSCHCYGDIFENVEHLVHVCVLTLHHPFTFHSPFWPVFLACGLYCVSKQHTYSISHSQTHTHTHLQMAAGLLRVCVSVCVGNVVPRISITGSRAGVSPHTKDAGRLEALGPNRGRDRRGKRKSASARSANSILTYISQSGK